VVRVVGAGVGHIVEDILVREAVPLSNGKEALGAERALRVNVEAFALAAAVVDGQLAGDGQGMAQLRLARAELAEHFRE
jgi:hypothetical protein